MKERILLAEKKLDKEKLHNVGALEINLQLSSLPDKRIYHQPSKSVSPDRDYPNLMPKGYPYITKKTEDLPKSASVRVNAVSVNVNTKPV